MVLPVRVYDEDLTNFVDTLWISRIWLRNVVLHHQSDEEVAPTRKGGNQEHCWFVWFALALR